MSCDRGGLSREILNPRSIKNISSARNFSWGTSAASTMYYGAEGEARSSHRSRLLFTRLLEVLVDIPCGPLVYDFTLNQMLDTAMSVTSLVLCNHGSHTPRFPP